MAQEVNTNSYSPVSVIIPCYRCAKTIDRAIHSIVSQSFIPAEIILIDDHSDDAGLTLKKLNFIKTKYLDVKIIQHRHNSGPGSARNSGWNIATQPYIAFLDADDSWHPRKLEIQYKWMKSNPEVTLTGHLSEIIEPGDSLPSFTERLIACPVGSRSLLVSNRFPTRSVMLRREIAYRFDPAKRYAEDYLLWLQIVMDGNSAWLLKLPLAYSYKADFGAGGLTENLWKMQRGELDTYMRIYLNGSISRVYYFPIVLFSLVKFLRRLIISSIWRGQ